VGSRSVSITPWRASVSTSRWESRRTPVDAPGTSSAATPPSASTWPRCTRRWRL
jgi:hypothetical protein